MYLREIDRMKLPESLQSLAHVLTDVSTVLQNFQEPVVFQAVRMSSVLGSHRKANDGDDGHEHLQSDRGGA